VRRTLELQIAEGLPGWENVPRAAGWEGVVVASAPRRPECEGRSIADLADEESIRPLDYVADLLLENDGQVIAVLHLMAESDVRNIVEFGGAMIGSDGLPLPGKPHPRLAGTFVRVLGRYAREERVLSLVEAVRKMTALPAERFGLHERGTVVPGKIADLVVFSAEDVIDRATFDDPLLAPAGVVHVVVGGRVTISDGQLTGVHAGRVLSSGARP
jgi:N-acyl-D-aspartate/D-glutamate deacylase